MPCTDPVPPNLAASGIPLPAEPDNGAMLVGFVDSEVAGAWHRFDAAGDEGQHWYSSYVRQPGFRGYTWAQAVGRGASAAHDLHTAPTQWAYDAACAALEKHRLRANVAEAALAAREAEVFRLREVLAAARLEVRTGMADDTALILTSCTCDRPSNDPTVPHRAWCNSVQSGRPAEPSTAIETGLRARIAKEVRGLPTDGFGRQAYADLHGLDLPLSIESHALMCFARARIADAVSGGPMQVAPAGEGRSDG